MLTLNEASGVITSPFYPRKYPNDQHCSWQITARKGKRVVLIIEEIHMPWYATCKYDYLKIQNGLPSDAASSRRRCGYNHRHDAFFSIRESLNVLFVSDSVNSRFRGFKANYTQVNYTNVTTGQ